MSHGPSSGGAGGAGAIGLERYYGKYRGKVTDTDDPKKLGRIKAQVPELLGDVDTGWALPCVPYAGDGIGFHSIPKVGSGVWIEFEAGDVSRPIWTGCFWGDGQIPKGQGDAETTPKVKIWRSEEGLLVSLDDDAKKICVTDKDGNNTLTIDANGGQITVKASSKVVVDAPAIELVDGASHAVVFGDSLLQYLNQVVSTFGSHTHAGQQAGPYPVAPTPPASPMPSPQQSMLSNKVKSG